MNNRKKNTAIKLQMGESEAPEIKVESVSHFFRLFGRLESADCINRMGLGYSCQYHKVFLSNLIEIERVSKLI